MVASSVVVDLNGQPLEVEDAILDQAGIEPGTTLTEDQMESLRKVAEAQVCADTQRRRAGGSPH